MDVQFDTDVISIEAIKKAAYRLSNVMSVDIRLDGQIIICTLTPSDLQDHSSEELAHAFRTTVLDQDLRESIAEKTEPLRNAIMALAFAPMTSRLDD